MSGSEIAKLDRCVCVCVCVSCSVTSFCCDPMHCSLLRTWKFSRKERWSGLPFPSPGLLPDPGLKPASLVPPALAGRFFTTGAACVCLVVHSCPTLCDPVDCSPSAPLSMGTLQERMQADSLPSDPARKFLGSPKQHLVGHFLSLGSHITISMLSFID